MKKEAREYYNRKLNAFDDVEDRVFDRVAIPSRAEIKNIHIVGICGKAMGSLAVLLKKAGYEVTGSDTDIYPPMSTAVMDAGILIKEGFKAGHIKGADVVVVGNVCRPDNPEAKEARDKKLPVMSVTEALFFFFMYDKKSVVVAGTHGKTTTTGLIAHLFLEAGIDPGYMVGGVPQDRNGHHDENARIGKGDYFVIEGDEYDTSYFDKAPKFLHYNPHIAIITSLEFDHLDIYKNMEDYTEAFNFLAKEVPEDGLLIFCGEEELLKQVSAHATSPILFYGLSEKNDVYARDIEINTEGQNFELVYKGQSKGRYTIPLSGRHNLLNTLAVCAVAFEVGISEELLSKGLASFQGMKRRQEIIFDKSVTVIDDFAHHPTAVRETIAAMISKYPDRRLLTLFEPRSNTSRRKIFEKEYGAAFSDVDLAFIATPPLREGDDPADFIDLEQIVQDIKQSGQEAFAFESPDTLFEAVLPHITKGDVILIMSNGDFGGIQEKLLEKLL